MRESRYAVIAMLVITAGCDEPSGLTGNGRLVGADTTECAFVVPLSERTRTGDSASPVVVVLAQHELVAPAPIRVDTQIDLLQKERTD